MSISDLMTGLTFSRFADSGQETATRFTFDGFAVVFPDEGMPEAPPRASRLEVYGTSDLGLSLMLEPGDEEDDRAEHDMEIDAGTLYSIVLNGTPLDVRALDNVLIEDMTFPGTGPVRLLTVDRETPDGATQSHMFYLSGTPPFAGTVPTLLEFARAGQALDSGDEGYGRTALPDGILALGAQAAGVLATVSVVPEMPEPQTLATFVSGRAGYETFLSGQAVSDDMPDGMTAFVSEPEMRNGPLAPITSQSAPYHQTMVDFASSVNTISSSLGLHLIDFEEAAGGNFAGRGATVTYTPEPGMTLSGAEGTMRDGTAKGTLTYGPHVTFHLFQTGNNVGIPQDRGDDPGIATHSGNDADRGYNLTPGGSQYLEVLPSETAGGGLAVSFDVPVYGFGFHLMGREDDKRDVYLDVHFADGSVYRMETGDNPLNTGGEQFYGLTLSPSQAASPIAGFVLYEPLQGEGREMRDIFAIDDLAVVMADKYDTLTPDEYLAVTLPTGEVERGPVTEERPTRSGSDDADTLTGSPGEDVLLGETLGLAPLEDIADQVFRLYRATLGRDPDKDGHRDWAGRILEGERDLEQVTDGFVGSAEFQSRYGALDDDGFVRLLYRNVLDRDADDDGLANWVGRLGSGSSRSEVVLGFSESQEFRTRTQEEAREYAEALTPANWSDDVYRLYRATLDRDPDVQGFRDWTGRLGNAERELGDVARGFVESTEFQQRYGSLDDDDFVRQLYRNVLEREADEPGLADWTGRLEGGTTRSEVLLGFSQSAEFTNGTKAALKAWMREAGPDDRLAGDGGFNQLAGGRMADTFVFDAAAGGTHRVLDLEPWDFLEFTGFGYVDPEEAVEHMDQSGRDVVFADQGVVVTIVNTQLGDIEDDMILV